jgi:hypothetical protein
MQWHELTARHQVALVGCRRSAHRIIFIFFPELTMDEPDEFQHEEHLGLTLL